MTLSSANSISDIENAYLDNANYEAQGSVTMCQAFLQACRMLLLRRPAEVRRGAKGSTFATTFNMEMIRAELLAARQWLAFAPAAQADGGVVFPSFLEARDYDSGYESGAPLAEPYGDQQV
jgi:hypothetical protein